MINIAQYLTNNLRKKKYRNNPNLLAGHCYVASEVLYHLYPGIYKSYFIRHENEPHWFLKEIRNGKIVDITASQFKTTPNYSKARGIGFLTKKPSKRAQIILDQII